MIKHRLIDIVDNLLCEYRALEINRGISDIIAEHAYQKIVETKGIKNIRKLKTEIVNMFQKIEIDKALNPLKIAIIGEIYVVHESILNLNIYKRLNELGIICKTPNTVRKLSDLPQRINPLKKWNTN